MLRLKLKDGISVSRRKSAELFLFVDGSRYGCGKLVRGERGSREGESVTMNKVFKTLLILFVLSSNCTARPAWVFLCSGQSNMAGLGEVNELAQQDKTVLLRVKIWNADRFVTLEAGESELQAGNLTRFGPEYNFSRTIARSFPDVDIYIIKYAASGRPLDQGWDVRTWKGPEAGPGRGTFYPGDSGTDPNVGKMYSEQMMLFGDALGHLAQLGIEYEIKGMIWMQGEADTKHATSAGRYAKNLAHLINRIHQDLDLTERFRFVFGEVLPYQDHLPKKYVAPAVLKESQFNAHHASGHKDAIAGAYIVPTGTFQIKADQVHFGTAGQMSLGKAMAESMVAALRSESD